MENACISANAYKLFKIREKILNPESILYKACILVNASWWLGQFQLFAFVRYTFSYGGGNRVRNK